MIRTFEITNGQDVIRVQILEEGTIVSEVLGQISGPNHTSAEGFLDLIAQKAGGETSVEGVGIATQHTHTHTTGETHTH